MNRRDFSKTAAFLSLAAFNTSIFGLENGRRFSLNFDFDLGAHDDRPLKLWVPLPLHSSYQKIDEFSFKSGSSRAFITENNEKEAKTLFAQWERGEQNRTLSISFKAALYSRATAVKEASEEMVKKFLLPSAHIPIDGIIGQTAKSICGGEKELQKKAKKIYDWVAKNTHRDPNVKGCGIGNPKMMLLEKKMGGKCFDISSLLVALLRASGISAREVFGIRVGESKLHPSFGATGNVTGAHHCKVEFFDPKRGWKLIDAGDVTKYRLAEKLSPNDPKALAMQKKLFDDSADNWLALNYGRDFALYPPSEQTPIDGFNYPYAELDGQTLDYYDAKTFSYSFNAKEF